MSVAKYTKSLDYSEENIAKLEEQGYKKSNVCKPYSENKVIRYNPKRGVYWFSCRTSAHMSDCYFVRQSVGTIYY